MISSTDRVFFRVGKLALDHIGTVAQFVQRRRSYGPEAMPGHAAVIAHPVECEEDRIFADRLDRPPARKDQFTAAIERVQLPERLDRLPRQRDMMRCLGLHALSRDRPFGLVEVDLRPGRAAQFIGPYKRQRQQLECQPGLYVAVVGVDARQQTGQVVGPQRRHGLGLGLGFQRPSKVASRVAVAAPGGDGKTKYLTASARHLMRRLDGAPRLNAPQSGQQFGRGDISDRAMADLRENEHLEALEGVTVVLGRPFRLDVLQPCTGNAGEIVVRSLTHGPLLRLPRRRWVAAGCDELADLFAFFTRLFQRHVGIHAEGQELFLTRKPVFKAPPALVGRCQQQVQAAPVRELLGLAGGLCLANQYVGKHGGNSILVKTCYPQTYPFSGVTSSGPLGTIWE